MTQSIVNEHKNHKEPAILWATRQKRYAPKTTVSRMTASINFVNARLNPDELIPDYLVRLTGLKDRIVECGGTVDESMFKGLMFRGFPDEYNVIKTNARINGDTLTVDDVKDQILEQYRLSQQDMMQIDVPSSETKAYATQHQQERFSGGRKKAKWGGKQGKKGKGKGSTKGGRVEKDSNEGKAGKNSSQQSNICFYCDEEGHWKKDCLKHRWEITQRKRKDYGGNQGPGSQNGSTDLVKWQWKKPDQSYSRSFHTAAVTYFAASLQTKSPNVWLFDSVCNAHITPFKNRIFEYRQFHVDESVFGIGGMEIKALGEGHGKLVDEFGRQFVLKQMLYCPKAEQPMLSMMKLLGEGAKVTFRDTNCILVFPGGCTLQGTAVNNLLHLTDYGRESHMAAITTRAQSRKETSKNDHQSRKETSKNGDDDVGDGEKGGEEIMEITDLDSSFQPISDSELDKVMSAMASSIPCRNRGTKTRLTKTAFGTFI